MTHSQIISPENYIANPKAYPNVRIIPEQRYALLEQLELQESIRRGLVDIAAGRVTPAKEVFNDIEQMLKNMTN